MTFLEYAAAMVGCYSALPLHERESLHAWEDKYVDGSGICSTSDWPGWEKYIGKLELPERRSKGTFGYVYLIQSESGHCKIGSSLSVPKRIRQLQCANPGPLILLHQFPSASAQQDEFALHKKFYRKRIRNEWFALDDLEIASICSMTASTNAS